MTTPKKYKRISVTALCILLALALITPTAIAKPSGNAKGTAKSSKKVQSSSKSSKTNSSSDKTGSVKSKQQTKKGSALRTIIAKTTPDSARKVNGSRGQNPTPRNSAPVGISKSERTIVQKQPSSESTKAAKPRSTIRIITQQQNRQNVVQPIGPSVKNPVNNSQRQAVNDRLVSKDERLTRTNDQKSTRPQTRTITTRTARRSPAEVLRQSKIIGKVFGGGNRILAENKGGKLGNIRIPAGNRLARQSNSERESSDTSPRLGRDGHERRNTVLIERTTRGTERRRPVGTRRVIYEDQPRIMSNLHRHQQVYRDRSNRLCNRIVQPRYSFGVYYRRGPRISVQYVFPYYHRKYVFVSLGGWWPVDYACVRYYWYPCHDYYWYGYSPIAREVSADTYNYYTYNYYGVDGTSTDSGISNADTGYVDHTTFADVREKLARQQAQAPESETTADTLFDEAVKAFEKGDYSVAAEKLEAAMELEPDDVILPFALSQALLADEQYASAAEILRAALGKVTPDKQGVFYPRGLYADEDVLMKQIEHLEDETQRRLFNTDLHLLLGYQLLGIGETDRAIESLTKAKEYQKNYTAASVLLELAEKIKAEDVEDTSQHVQEGV